MAGNGTATPKSHAAGPLDDFTHPGRRRTDHPMIAGTIVLCLGILAAASMAQVGALFWVGWQVRSQITAQVHRDEESAVARKRFSDAQDAQIQLLLRHCVHSAADEAERNDCLRQVKPIVVVTPK